MAFDKSTDIQDNLQLAIFAHYVSSEMTVKEELFDMMALQETRRDIDIKDALDKVLTKAQVPLHLFYSFIHFNFILDHQHCKFYTVKSSRESRKGRRRKMSNVKACKKKPRKKVKKKHYGAWLRHQKTREKEKKIKLKNNFN